MQLLAPAVYFRAQGGRDDPGQAGQGALRDLAQLRVHLLPHELAAEEQEGRFGGGEAERGEEVAFHQAVALARDGHHRDAGLREGLHVAVDGTQADLEAPGQVLRSQHPAGLQFQQDAQQPVGAVHRARCPLPSASDCGLDGGASG